MNKKIITCYVFLTILLIAALEIFLSHFLKEHYISGLKNALFIKARILGDLLSQDGFDGFCKKYRDEIEARITVISESGRILCDSDRLATSAEDYSNRPEVLGAMSSGRGLSIRYSSTLNKDSLYVASLVETSQAEYSQRSRQSGIAKMIIRLSISLDKVDAELARIRIPIIISTLIVVLGVFFIGVYWMGRFRREVEEIIEFSDSIVEGGGRRGIFEITEYSQIIRSDLSKLAGHVVSMARELERRLNDVKKEKKTLEAVLKNMKEGIMIIDQKNSVSLINDSLKEMLGITVLEGMQASEVLRNAELISIIEESRRENKAVSKEISLRDGRYLYVRISPMEVSEKNGSSFESAHFIMTFHEITRLKRLEEIRRDFVANVAHEIKTPITAIRGFAETLLDGAIDDRDNAVRFLGIIKRHSERLNSLVSDLLTLSAIEQGELGLEISEVNLTEVIDSVFSLMGEKARAKGLYLKRSLHKDNIILKADRDKLFQILLNLIDNGIKFTESGGVTVGSEIIDGKEVLFVEDTGCGIEERHLHRLGERFYRVDRARSRELGGTGLGLAIVKHLVKAHRWDIKIESIVGKGTKVKIFGVSPHFT